MPAIDRDPLSPWFGEALFYDIVALRSEGVDLSGLTFAFRPLWQMDAATTATVALTKAQATQIYARLGLWPSQRRRGSSKRR